jgi:hypothetical protein
MNQKLLPFICPLILGSITIEVAAYDQYNQSDIERVEFFIDDQLVANITSEPYQWTWNKIAFFSHEITIIAYDISENNAQDSQQVWKFF